MNESTLFASSSATPFFVDAADLNSRLLSLWTGVIQLGREFLAHLPTPQTTHKFESNLSETLRKVGREILSWVYNHIEPEDPESSPKRVEFQKQEYRRKPKSPNHNVGTRFGTITLNRFLYEPLEAGEHAIFPLEINLGVAARNATPALAERVAELASSCTQTELLSILRREHDIHWAVGTLRKVTAHVSQGMVPHLHKAQVAQVLAWLRQAHVSKGPHKVVLTIGRDGIFLPIRAESSYKEGAVASVSVYDRRGKRLGTVYLGQMPEPGQTTLSNDLTALIQRLLSDWKGPLPRLAYVTDAGYHPTWYCEIILQRMQDPRRPDTYLQWIWIVDFYHASEYVGKLAESLFGNTREGHAWSRKMCHWLKHKSNGVYRVLHSAAKHRSERILSKHEEAAYQKAYEYLLNYRPFMDYVQYRRQGLPIGSGVTEAACKTVFTQRFKQSGMSWDMDDGQIILDLRLIRLSRLWTAVHKAYLACKPLLHQRTEDAFCKKTRKKAA